MTQEHRLQGALRGPAAWLSAACVALIAAAPASATDDRDNSTPVGWRYYYSQTAAQIDAIRGQGFRIVSLDVESTSPMRFTAAFVFNGGSYFRTGRSWHYGTPGSLVGKSIGKRITALTPYVINGQLHLAASMIDNTGNQKKDWTFYYGNISFVASRINQFEGRPIDVDAYVINNQRYYTALIVKNRGANKRSFWWYRNATTSFISGRLAANNARMIDLRRNTATSYDCLMVGDLRSSPRTWWYPDVSASKLAELVSQNGARISSIMKTNSLIGPRFQVVMINNANALTTRIGNILRTTTGRAGAYLKEVGGSARASLLPNEVFEPAATLNVLRNTHALLRVEQKKIALTTSITSWQGNKDACPSTSAQTKLEPLHLILRHMMQKSDNYRTMSIELGFGRTNINATAAALGMAKTRIRHRQGCFGPPASELTLADAGRLYEAVANGFLGSTKPSFYHLMIRGNYDSVINQEAAKLALQPNVISAFKASVKRTYMTGSYDVGSRYFRSGFGWFRLPFCIDKKVVLKEYVGGVFTNDATNANAANNVWGAWNELARDEIRAALTTWKNAPIAGSLTAFGSGCSGSNGVATHFAVGVPDVGNTVTYSLKNGPKLSFAILQLGVSTQSWGALPLPFDLAPLKAPSCNVYLAWMFGVGGPTSLIGGLAVPIPLPNSKALVGKSFHTQFACVDPTANELGLTLSNAVTTKLGGVAK